MKLRCCMDFGLLFDVEEEAIFNSWNDEEESKGWLTG